LGENLVQKPKTLKDGAKTLVIFSLLLYSFGPSFLSVQSLDSSFVITNLKVKPVEVKIGEIVTITADVINMGNMILSYEVTLLVNNEKEDSQNVTLAANETTTVEFTYIPLYEGLYNVTIEDESATFYATAPAEPKFRIGPVVRLRPVNDVITASKDGVVELFFSNPLSNEGITLRAEIWVSVPSGVHVYGEGFSLASGAGIIYGRFQVLPGTARTIYMSIKADETAVGKTHFIHFYGIYWPNENRESYQTISLTHPFKVVEASPNPYEPAPTNPTQAHVEPKSQSGGIGFYLNWSGITPWIIIAIIVVGIALIAVLRR
jgi:hypothetical protein